LFLFLKGQRRTNVIANRVLRKIFGPNMEERRKLEKISWQETS